MANPSSSDETEAAPAGWAEWIDSPALLERFVAQLSSATELAVDLEFQGEGRYIPLLCLVQIAARVPGPTGSPEIVAAAIDPLKLDLAPLGPLLKAPATKIFHAGGQDLSILNRVLGEVPRPVFDTQVAASFLGHGETPGYARLAQALLGVNIDKGQRFTDWTRRPLAPEQVVYALEDVRHLLPLATRLKDELTRAGRMAWAQAAFGELADHAQRRKDPRQAYLRIGKLTGLSARQLGVLRELCAWREERAQAIDRPIGWLLGDDTARQLAMRPPRSASALKGLRGVRGDIMAREAEGLLAAVGRGLELEAALLPEPVLSPRSDPRVDAMTSLLAAVVRSRATELELAPSVLGSRDDLCELVTWHLEGKGPRPEVKVLDGWRAEAIGADLMAVLEGRIRVGIDGSGAGGIGLYR